MIYSTWGSKRFVKYQPGSETNEKTRTARDFVNNHEQYVCEWAQGPQKGPPQELGDTCCKAAFIHGTMFLTEWVEMSQLGELTSDCPKLGKGCKNKTLGGQRTTINLNSTAWVAGEGCNLSHPYATKWNICYHMQ